MFETILQLHPRTITENAGTVSSSDNYKPYKTVSGQLRKRKLSLQSVVFFAVYRALWGVKCHGISNRKGLSTGTACEFSHQWYKQVTYLRILLWFIARTNHSYTRSTRWEGPTAVFPAYRRLLCHSVESLFAYVTYYKDWQRLLWNLYNLKNTTLSHYQTGLQEYQCCQSDRIIEMKPHRSFVTTEICRTKLNKTLAEAWNTSFSTLQKRLLLPHLVRQPGQLYFTQVPSLTFSVFPVAIIDVHMCLDYQRVIGQVVKLLVKCIQCWTTLFNNIVFRLRPAPLPEFSIYMPAIAADKKKAVYAMDISLPSALRIWRLYQAIILSSWSY